MEQTLPVAPETSGTEVNNCNYSSIRETKCPSSDVSSPLLLSSQIAPQLAGGLCSCGANPCQYASWWCKGGPGLAGPGRARLGCLGPGSCALSSALRPPPQVVAQKEVNELREETAAEMLTVARGEDEETGLCLHPPPAPPAQAPHRLPSLIAH